MPARLRSCLQHELPRRRVDGAARVHPKDAAPIAVLELFLAMHDDAEEAGQRVDGNAAKSGTAHGGVEEGAVALDQQQVVAVVDRVHERIVRQIPALQLRYALIEIEMLERWSDG